ncbi:MAG: LysM domain-containing protein [bacterium]|nr:LysM domain-containing protein [bacterium]MDI1337410.1 LysM domain-containing protein [Lacunisphaera sp.]
MDTLSRDSNGSGSILPLVGVIAGGLALVLSITALFKLSTLQKTVAAHDAEIPKIATLESEVRATASKADADVKSLRTGIQSTFDQVGAEIGTINAKLAKIEEAQKARAAAPAGKGGGGAVTGTVDANGNYSVAPGDTISKIAKKFATKVDTIEAENPGLDPAKLKVGQKIKIPKK